MLEMKDCNILNNAAMVVVVMMMMMVVVVVMVMVMVFVSCIRKDLHYGTLHTKESS
jgi:hypothetical protein